MKKIFVTGGAGFIGSHLVKKLTEDGHRVTVLDNLLRGNKIDKEIFSDINFVQGDVRDAELVKKISKGCDIIFHFAAVLGVDIVADNPVETMDTEVIGMRNVADAAMLNNTEKIIYASTSGIYGHSALEKSMTEEILVDPRTSYAIAKRYNEIYLKALFEEKGLESISLRFFNVYGDKQDTRMVIPRFFEQATNNKPISVFGKGNQTRDFTYIDDTVTACIKLIRAGGSGEIFNIANEKEIGILELAEAIKKITGSRSEIQFIEAPKKRYDYEVERRFGSSGKLFTVTGYKPMTTLKDGLHKMYELHKQRH